MVGVTGFEPVTLRLSSACSNQLSYTPSFKSFELRVLSFELTRNPKPQTRHSESVGGAEEIRTPDL